MKRFAATLLVLLMTASMHAATIHVNNLTGKDNAKGTSADQAVATFKRATALLMPGDDLNIVNTGKAYHERLVLNREWGTPHKPLVVEGNGAVLSGLVSLDTDKWVKQANGVYAYPMPKMGSNLNPVLMAGESEIPSVKTPAELQAGQCCWQPESLLFMPENQAILTDGNLQASLIDSGVAVQYASYITIRNIISERHPNDGFNFHGNVRGIILENVEARLNGDDGCSIHEDGQLFVRNAWFHHNYYGIEDVNASNSTYQNVVVEDNVVGAHFSGGVHQLTDSILRNNQTHQLRVSHGKPSNYLGKDDASFIYDSLCVAKNVQMQGGKAGVTVTDRARAFLNNCLITDTALGLQILPGSLLELRNSVVQQCSESLIKLDSGAYFGDANLLAPGRLVRDNVTMELPAWVQATSSDKQSVMAKPNFAFGSTLLATQPIANTTVGLTAVYPNPMLPEDATKINDDAPMLQALIDRAIDSNQKTLRLPAGTYRIGQMLRIENATDLAIDASGVTVIMTQWEPVLNFHKCSGVTFTGMTVDYDPLPFTQGVVTSVEPDGVRFEMQLDKGYPTYEQMGKRVHLHVFDPVTRFWKADVWDMYPQEVKSLGDGKLQITPSKAESNLAVGDLVAIDTRTSRAMNVTRSSGPNTFKDITFYTAPGLVICGRECDAAQTFDHIVIKRGPLPAGATSPRLMSSSADGINFAYSRVGPVLENCDFSFMGDDSLNVHGALLPVMMVPDARTLIVARLSNNDIISRVILPGDPIRILTRDTFAIEKQLKVVKVETYQGKRDIDFQQMQKDFFTSTITRARSENYTLFAVTVDQDHGAAVMQQVIDFPTFNCSGYVVRNNYFHDHRARGLRLMGNDGLVEGNTFERLGQCAISIGAEMGYWAEAGWVQNVMIRNNTIRDVNRDRNATSESSLVLGAIGTFLHTNVKTPPFLGHRKITIQNNTIDGSGTAGIYLYGADEVTITGNTIRNTNTRDASLTGSAWGLTVTKPLEVIGAEHQSVRDNQIQ